jgi:hypothetical protein
MSLGQVLDARAGARPTLGGGFIAWLLSIYATFHIALIFLMPDAAERFMLGDRSNDRSIKLQALLDTESWDAFFRTLFHQASPGDYILFAPAWTLGGPTAVMLQNIALIGLGAWFLWKLAGLFFSPRVAAIATTAYLLLPATLFHPHAFVSEAICNPLLIAASYFFLRHATSDKPQGRDLAIAALLTAVLVFTRHVFLPLPLFFAALLVLAGPTGMKARLRSAAILMLAGYALVAAWGAAAYLAKPVYGAGESVGGMEANLFLRAQRMAGMITCPLPTEVEQRIESTTEQIQTLPARDFIKFVQAHPRTFVKTVVYDVFNITANPGMAMVYGRFFGVFDLGEDSYEDYGKWRDVRDREGIPGLVTELWRTSPLGLIVNVLGALAWAGFVAVALWGTWSVIRDRAQPLALKLLAVGLPAYLIAFSSVAAGYTRWDHRSPMEFLIALLFAAGVVAIVDAVRARRGDGA